MPTAIDNKNLFPACLLGGAIGDALGAPVEFMSIDEIRRSFGPDGITDFIEHPGHRGEFTDDTQMTLFTAEGLLRAYHRASVKGIGGATLPLTYHAYRRWLHTQGESMDAVEPGWGEDGIDSGWLIKQQGLFKRRLPKKPWPFPCSAACFSKTTSGAEFSLRSTTMAIPTVRVP